MLAAVLTILGLGMWQLIPSMIVQFDQLGTAIPTALKRGQEWLNHSPAGRIVSAHAGPVLGGFMAKAGQISFSLLDALVALVIAALIGAYLAAAPGEYRHGLLLLAPPEHRDPVDKLLRSISETLGWWALGQLVLMTVLGIVTMIGLLILQIPLVFALSIFTGAMVFIPFVGAVIAFFVTVLVTLSSDPAKVPFIAILFVVVHVLEGYILVPLVQRRAVRLPPALTIFSQLIMTTLFGFIGLVLATPFAAACLALSRELLAGAGELPKRG